MKHNEKRRYEFLLDKEGVELLDLLRGKMAAQLHKEGADREFILDVITNDDVLLLEILRKTNSLLKLLLGRD